MSRILTKCPTHGLKQAAEVCGPCHEERLDNVQKMKAALTEASRLLEIMMARLLLIANHDHAKACATGADSGCNCHVGQAKLALNGIAVPAKPKEFVS